MSNMKQIVVEVEGAGLDSLLGKKVLVMCMNYFYTGVLSGVGTTCIKLDNAAIVYETGAWSDKQFKDAQSLGENPHYVNVSAIESFRELS